MFWMFTNSGVVDILLTDIAAKKISTPTFHWTTQPKGLRLAPYSGAVVQLVIATHAEVVVTPTSESELGTVLFPKFPTKPSSQAGNIVKYICHREFI